MCVAALHPNLWLAYDPATCALERAFGGAEFHGKVYDFGQQNTRALPPIWFEQQSILLDLPALDLPAAGYSLDGVELDDGLSFTKDGARLTSPTFDTTRFQNVMVYFEEKSRRAPFRVEVLLGEEIQPRQWFHSTLHRDSDTQWQENAKSISVRDPAIRLRFVQTAAGDAKRLRGLRVKGAYRAWRAKTSDRDVPVEVDWGGYVRSGPSGEGRLTLRYALMFESGLRVSVEESPEVISVTESEAIVERRFKIVGLPEGHRARLSLAGRSKDAGYRLVGGAVIAADDSGAAIEFSADGESTLEQRWGKP